MIADRLRKAVLQAAIEGKLTEQLSEDGNAIDLLKQIKTKNVVKNDIPFEIPENWIWTKLGVIGKSNIGLTYKPENIKTSGTLVLRSSNIQNGILTYDDNVFVELDIPENKFAQVNDILICARNGSKRLVGKAAIIDKQGMSFGAFMSIYRTAFYNYVYYYLQSPYFRQDFDGVSTTTINQITQSNLLNRLIPLPPFEEQKRIVEKLEVLLAEIDKLEQDEKALKDLEDKFPEKLKNAIIQAAIEGKLVDNSTKESAFTELDEKTQRLYLNNKDKYKLPFDIPNSWILMPIFQSYEFVNTGVSIYEGEKKYFSTGSIKEEFKPEGTYTFENRPSRANR
jgi:type I restriction enzyme S subunit